MAFTLDPEVASALAPMPAAMADMVRPPVGDVGSRRPVLQAILVQTAAAQPIPTDVKTADFHVTAVDDEVLLRWYARDGSAAGPAVSTSMAAG